MAEEKIEFLWNAANSLLSERYGSIRSNLLSRCQDYARYQVNLPRKMFDISAMCENCSTPWQYGHHSTKVLPSSKKIRRILSKVENYRTGKSNIKPSRIQKLKNSSGNKLVMTCGVCQHKNVIKLEKPSKPCETVIVTDNTPPHANKRSKKKKDKFAGLSEKAVLSAIPKHVQSKKRLSFKKDSDLGKSNDVSIGTPKINAPKLNETPKVHNQSNTLMPKSQDITKKNISSKKINKSKVLLKVDNNKKLKGENSIKALAEILKRNKNNDGNSTSRLKQLMK